jgi:putative acetyltransferase
VIRRYQASDLEQLLDVWYAAAKVAHAFLGEDFFKRERIDITSVYLPEAETWVYEQEDKVIGFISLLGNEVGGLFVHPQHQRKGIGRLLMDHVASIRKTLELDVFEQNIICRSFYEQYGFVKTGEVLHHATQMNQIRVKFQSP